MTKRVKKAIIEIKPDRGNFLPLSDCVPKELFLLGDMPILKYITDEAISVGVEDIIFLTDRKDSILSDFFKDLENQKELLKKRGFKRAESLSDLVNSYGDIEFSYEKRLTDATRGAEDFLFISSDVLIESKKSSCEQLMSVFRTSERPVVGLREADMGDIKAEKIAKGLYKVKGFTDEATLTMIGRGLFTSESRKFFEGKESLEGAIEAMIERGHTVYGTVISGEVFELTDSEEYQRANLSYALNSDYGEKYKEFVKKRLQ